MLLILGGCMQGVNGAGSVSALHRLGLQDVFDAVVGVSTGAGIAAYFLSGYRQTLLGTSIYYNECISKDFIDFRRVRKIADIDYIERTLRKGRRALDVERMRAARSNFYVAVTDGRTGKGKLLDVKTAKPDSIMALKASMAMFFLYRDPVYVNGRQYLDGAFGHPFPIKEIVERFSPTDVLVLPNGSLHEPFLRILGEEVLAHLSLRHRRKLIEAVHRHHRLLREGVRYFKTLSGIHTAALFPPVSNVHLFTQDKASLKRQAGLSAKKTFRAFGGKPKSIRFL